jgi:hypothetical protein
MPRVLRQLLQINPSKPKRAKPGQIQGKKSWICLVVRIRPFQWDTANPSKKFSPALDPRQSASLADLAKVAQILVFEKKIQKNLQRIGFS